MDFAALLCCAAVLGKKVKPLRLTAAAALGGVYAVGSLFLSSGQIAVLLLDAAVGFLLCRIAFGRAGGRQTLLCGLFFFALSFFLGGAVTALYGFLQRRGDLPKGKSSGASLLLQTAALAALGAVALGKQALRTRGRRSAVLRLGLCGRQLTLEGLADSGHLAREPLSSLPVVVLSLENGKALLGDDETKALLESPTALPGTLQRKLRMIPVRSLFGKGLLPAFRADLCLVDGCPRDVYLAIDTGSSEKQPYGGYGALLSESLCPTGHTTTMPKSRSEGGNQR